MILTDDAGEGRPIDAILFDMDGTLVDSVAATLRAWTTWAALHGVTDRLVIAHGQPAEATVIATLPDAAPEVLAAHLAEQRDREATDLAGVTAAEGALDLLAWLDAERIPWAVVTSADTRLAEARLGTSGIAPSRLVTRDHVGQGKPHPEPFLLGADRLGVDPTRCLVVEDTQAGVDSGRAAGSTTAGLGSLLADIVVQDIPHLHRVLLAAPA